MRDLIGLKFGMLTILDTKIVETKGKNRIYNRIYAYCKCDCGNEKWIRFDGIKAGTVKACGCLTAQKNDLAGKRFGELTAIKLVGSIKFKTKWLCKCECGKEVIVNRSNLINGQTKTCGHANDWDVVYQKFAKENFIDGTSIKMITREDPCKSNKSGVTGVSFDSRRGKWRSHITFKTKYYHLGYFLNKEDAIKARKEAEERLHKEFLREKGIID